MEGGLTCAAEWLGRLTRFMRETSLIASFSSSHSLSDHPGGKPVEQDLDTFALNPWTPLLLISSIRCVSGARLALGELEP